MKKKKTYKLFNKIRAALRDVYRYSPMRKEAIENVSQKDPEQGLFFECPLCTKQWPIQMADVDHEPPLGSLDNFGGVHVNGTLATNSSLNVWASNLFFGPTQVICKICHKKKTVSQRKKAKV